MPASVGRHVALRAVSAFQAAQPTDNISRLGLSLHFQRASISVALLHSSQISHLL